MLRTIIGAALAVLLAGAAASTVYTQSGPPTELFFSEYIEGSSFNKALEIYNGTSGPIDLTAGGYIIQMYFNGSTSSGLNIPLSGTIAAGDVFVVTNASASDAIKTQ